MGITVIIPVYNCEKYIKRCVESILDQKQKFDIEIIIVNDGSNDSSAAILDALAESRDDVTVYHTSNRGVSHARNYGLARARFSYVWFVDADDYVDEDVFNEIFFKLSQCPDVLALSFIKKYNEKEEIILNTKSSPNEYMKDFLSLRYDASVWQFIFKKSFLQHISFDERLAYSEDALFLTQVFMRNPKIIFTNKICYHYIINSNGAVSTFSARRISTFYAIDEIERHISSNSSLYKFFSFYKATFYFNLTLGMIENNLNDNMFSVDRNRDWLKRNWKSFFYLKQGKRDSLLFLVLISPFYRCLYKVLNN